MLPPGAATEADRAALQEEVVTQKQVTQITRKQKSTGIWADNILGLAPAKRQGINGVGTVSQYRRLLELGHPLGSRPFRLAERTFYRLLSRDEDPALLFEYRTGAKTNPEYGTWGRNLIREGISAALAQGGHIEDPRLRGSAHRISSEISQFLRSGIGEKPLIRKKNRTILHPEAYPPTVYSVSMIAYMPSLQRERAGFVQRLCDYLAKPASKRTFSIVLGRKIVKPTFQLLGDPIQADAAGRAKDIPFALHWIEVLTRLGMLESSTTAPKVLNRLLGECDARGVWNPKGLRSLPKSPSKMADFAFPLELDGKTVERRQADVTFRLALIAKLAGWTLEYT